MGGGIDPKKEWQKDMHAYDAFLFKVK